MMLESDWWGSVWARLRKLEWDQEKEPEQYQKALRSWEDGFEFKRVREEWERQKDSKYKNLQN